MARLFEVTITGIPQTQAALARAAAIAPAAAGQGLQTGARPIIEASQEAAPVKFGNLVASHKQLPPVVTAAGAQVDIEAGGEAGPDGFPVGEVLPAEGVTYAQIQHESGSRPQFLADAAEMNAEQVAEEVQRAVLAAILGVGS